MAQIARSRFDSQVKKVFAHLSEIKVNELTVLFEAILKKMHINTDEIEAVEHPRKRRTICFLTQSEEIEIGLDETFGAPRRRVREYIEERGGEIFQPGASNPSGGRMIRPIRIS